MTTKLKGYMKYNGQVIEIAGGGGSVPSNADYVIDYGESSDGTQWYRQWNSGWLEQGGAIAKGSSEEITITYLKDFADANYTISKNCNNYSAESWTVRYLVCYSLTTTSCKTYAASEGNASWYACGKGAKTPNQSLSAVVEGAAIDTIYPVGSVVIRIDDVNPSTLWTGTTWEKISSGRCLMGATDDIAVGTEVEAGLPNIEGSILGTDGSHGGMQCISPTFNDAFQGTQKGAASWNGSTNGAYDVTFDASLSNSIYGNSDTVQPPALAVNIWKRTA